MSEQYLRVRDVIARYSISRAYAYELISSGVIPAVRIGTALRVPASALDEIPKPLVTHRSRR